MIFDDSSLIVFPNCCFSADLLIGRVISVFVLVMRSDFGSSFSALLSPHAAILACLSAALLPGIP
jgi:hypothetical protein